MNTTTPDTEVLTTLNASRPFTEFDTAIHDAFRAIVESGKLQAIITAQVETTVKETVTNALRAYSDFGKALDHHIRTSLAVDFDKLTFAEYNQVILGIIKTKLDANISRFADEQFAKQLEDLLQSPPAEIKLSTLVAQLQAAAEEDDIHGDAVTCHIEESDTSAGWHRLYLDKRGGQDKNDCQYRISVTKDGEVYSLSIPHYGDVTKRVFAGRFYNFDRTLFQLWAAKTRLIINEF